MVTMHRGSNWKVTVYKDHGVPHFHIEGPGYRSSVAIATLETIIGSVPANVEKAAVAWATANQVVLMSKWQELNP